MFITRTIQFLVILFLLGAITTMFMGCAKSNRDTSTHRCMSCKVSFEEADKACFYTFQYKGRSVTDWNNYQLCMEVNGWERKTWD